MKIIQFIFFIFLLSSCLEQKIFEIENVNYRDWKDCYKLSNKRVSVIVNPNYGGHILFFGLYNTEDNILWSDSIINGWNLNDYRRTGRGPDAGRFDVGNERKTEKIHDLIWAGEYEVFVEKYGIRLVSQLSHEMGIKVERIFTLEDDEPVLRIKQRMYNVSDSIQEYSFWTRTLLPAGGLYLSQAKTTMEYPNGFSEISLVSDSLINDTVYDDRVYNRYDCFVAHPGGEKERKYGINTTNGIYLYYLGNYLYVKQNIYYPSNYYNNNRTSFPNMIYFNENFVEIEPNSPMVKINPGEVFEYDEIWSLILLNQIQDKGM